MAWKGGKYDGEPKCFDRMPKNIQRRRKEESVDSISWMEEGGKPPEMIKDLSDELCAPGEGGALLIGGPSWVRTPPELGSKKMSITRQGMVDMNCPVCRRQRPVYVLELEEDVHVSCCENCKQYGWFRPRNK